MDLVILGILIFMFGVTLGCGVGLAAIFVKRYKDTIKTNDFLSNDLNDALETITALKKEITRLQEKTEETVSYNDPYEYVNAVLDGKEVI